MPDIFVPSLLCIQVQIGKPSTIAIRTAISDESTIFIIIIQLHGI